jgi:hypothetical protein
VDLGAVIPSSLEHGDIADIVALLDGRKVVFCDAKDRGAPELAALRERFVRVTEAAKQAGALTYAPNEPLGVCPSIGDSVTENDFVAGFCRLRMPERVPVA